MNFIITQLCVLLDSMECMVVTFHANCTTIYTYR